jgi:hypothetical protein
VLEVTAGDEAAIYKYIKECLSKAWLVEKKVLNFL